AVEGAPLGRERPGLGLGGRQRALPRAEVQREAEQAAVPADAYGAGAEGVPHLSRHVGDLRDVLELEARALGALLGEAHGDPRDAPAELPRHAVLGAAVGRRRALEHLAAGVALELVAPAEAQIAR